MADCCKKPRVRVLGRQDCADGEREIVTYYCENCGHTEHVFEKK